MSKTQLKKELEKMSAAQLVEIILDVYDARKEAKDYFEFFINPDSAKLEEKYKKVIAREMARTKRRMSRARISVIKKAVKEFESFSPEFDTIIDLYLFILRNALSTEKYYEFTDSLINGIAFLTDRLLEKADSNLILDRVIAEIDCLTSEKTVGSKGFKTFIKKRIQYYLEEKSV